MEKKIEVRERGGECGRHGKENEREGGVQYDDEEIQSDKECYVRERDGEMMEPERDRRN